ncbi:hypothetical protein LINPERHAP2_LOCUS143 [Linum perenne]
MYCCLAACKDGFLVGCRKIICIDRCFLKTLHGGQLLSAVGIDGNYGIFPIAYAVVRVENGENWNWFLQYLCRDFDTDENTSGDWTFMSDKQKISVLIVFYLSIMCYERLYFDLFSVFFTRDY